MKKTTLIFLLFPFLVCSQNVSTLVTSSGINDEMTFDLEGHLLGSNFHGSAVTKVLLPAAETSLFSDGYDTPNGMVTTSDGTVYLADNFDNKIYKISPDGNADVFVEIYSPSGLAFLPGTDTLVAASYYGNKVSKIAPDGTIIEWSTGGILNSPVPVVIDDNGQVYVGNFEDRRIVKIFPNGTQAQLTQAPTFGWLGSITYSQGWIYGTLYDSNKIFRADLSGNAEVILGGAMGSADGGPGEAQFNSPVGIIAAPGGDTLYVSEGTTYNLRMITDLEGLLNASSEEVQPLSFECHPNPMHGFGRINFELLKPETISLSLLDISGNVVQSFLKSQKISAGFHQIEFDATEFHHGIYSLALNTENGKVFIRKVVLMN